MKAYKLVYTFSKNVNKGEIEYKENIKQEDGPEEDVKQVLDYCLNSIKSHYANYSEEYNGYFCAFSFNKLDSGSFCIYKLDGKDGIYTASILIFKDGYLPFYPIQLYGSDVLNVDSINNKGFGILFSGGLAGKLKPVEGINFEKASIFLKGKVDHSLRNMLDILLDAYENVVFVKVYDRIDNIILWITAIQRAFPAEIAHSIFFSIETNNPDSAECIITTSENGLKNIEETESKEIYSFNFIMGRISKAINEFRLTRLVEMGYIISAETLNAFHRFLSKFNFKKVDRELEKCYKLFNMINFGLGNTEGEDVREAIGFALLYGPQAVLEELFEGIQNVLIKIEYELDLEKVKILSEFMYKVAVKSKERIYLDKANDFFFRFTDEIVIKSNIIDEEDLFSFYENIKKIALRYVDRIIKRSISTVRLKQIGEYLGKDMHPIQSEFYMRIIIGDLMVIKSSWNRAKHIEGFGEFIKACIEGLWDEKVNYEQIFNTISRDVDYFAHVSLLLYNRLLKAGYTEDFVRSFSQCISEKTIDWADEAHSAIHEIDINTKLIFEEFIINLKESSNKPDYFWNRFRYGQKDTPGYLKNYTAEAVKIYISLLDEKDIPVESAKLIRFIVDKEIILDKETLRNIIKDYENTLELVEPNEEELVLIQNIDKIKKEKFINTLPDICGLITFAMWVSNPGGGHSLKLKDIFEDCPDFKRIDHRYFQYLIWCLPHIIEYSEVSDDHKQIIDQFCRADVEEEFFNLYIEIIKKRCDQNKSSGYSKVLNFLFSYYFYTLPKYAYMGETHLIENMNQRIAELLEGDYVRNINDLDKDLTYEFQKRELSVPVMWKDIYIKSKENRRNPILKQVMKIFSKNNNLYF
jgi:hypothetical protein